MSDIFISYKAEDRARVSPLVDALEADGLSVWWDAHIGGGDDWRDTIARHLDDAKCVIVVWSKRSIAPEGRFVRDEAARAQRRGAYLPVRIDAVDPPLGFGESQALALNNWKGARTDPRYAALLAAAKSMVGIAPRADAPKTAASPRMSRRVLLGGGAVAVLAAAGGGWFYLRPRSAATDSIAVLPFANLSGDPAQAYFSDGIAEELRNALSRIAGLKVVARTSSEMLRDADATTAAHKLDVANILTGSVRRSASTIRVAAQLVDGRNGLELWSQSFDRPFGDVLQIQSGIATSVADALKIRLGSKDRAELAIGGTQNAAAQDLVLQAAPKVSGNEQASMLRAIQLLDAAIALDPNYADAYAQKAFVLTAYAGTYERDFSNYRARMAEAEAAAKRAIGIEPRLGRSYASLGAIYRNELKIGPALDQLHLASTLPGSDPTMLAIYASLLSQMGRFDEALKVIVPAELKDPLNPLAAQTHQSILYQARRYPEALDYGRRQLQAMPTWARLHVTLGNTLLMLGRNDQALSEYRAVPPDNLYRMIGLAFVAARTGDLASAERQRAEVVAQYGDSAHYQYAEIDAQIGNRDRAFAELESAWKFRDPGLAGLKVDPLIEPLRSDPRFPPMLARLNIPRG